MGATRQQITLPGGGTLFVRKLKQEDFIEIGQAPAALVQEAGKKRTARQLTPEEAKWFEQCNKIILTRCTTPVVDADGKRRRIVDKPFAEAAEHELSIEEMDDADAVAIIKAVSDFTGLGEEAGRKARPFPEEPPVAGGAGPDGHALPPAAPPAPAPEPG